MITVEFTVHATRYHIDKALEKLDTHQVLSFDTETAGVYAKAERKEAEQLLKDDMLPLDVRQLCLLVANNNGLSFPSLTSVTHFVFGLNDHESVILICDNPRLEKHIWQWIEQYHGLFLIHNTLFDLKLMYHRLKKFPRNFEDTALLAKTLLNNAETWRSKVGLKELMADYYDPSWALLDEYEPEDLHDPKFLKYASIDGAATFKLWDEMQHHLLDQEGNL